MIAIGRKAHRQIFWLILLVPLGACALFSSKQERALERSPDYRMGYQDGCASAAGPDANPRQNALVRDDELFRTSKAYQIGWREGMGACRSTATGYGGSSIPGTMPEAGPIPDPSVGNGGLPRN